MADIAAARANAEIDQIAVAKLRFNEYTPLEERRALVGLVRVRPAEEHLLGPQGRGRPWSLADTGAFPS